jgi:hypothetical protein
MHLISMWKTRNSSASTCNRAPRTGEWTTLRPSLQQTYKRQLKNPSLLYTPWVHLIVSFYSRDSVASNAYHAIGSDTGGFNSHITTTHVPLIAKDNLKVAQHWLQTCLSNHPNCHAFHHSTVTDIRQRPTRVLEVTLNTVRLRCNMARQSFDYLALSHMWGKVEQLKLTTSILKSFQADVPFNHLSPIYKEAVRVTRALGYRYLWIDSLCIVQDSAEDWEYEASRMAIVYGNAVCNLAYLFPSDSQVHQREDPRLLNPCILRPGNGGKDKTVYIQHSLALWRVGVPKSGTGNPMDHVIQSKWPLFRRAW